MTEEEQKLPEGWSGESGGTVRVAGTIVFSFEVNTSDCNVFSPEELIKEIESDKIGWFIDYWLGEPTASTVLPEGVDPDSEEAARLYQQSFEKYKVIDFSAVRAPKTKTIEGVKVELVEEVTDKYNVPDPDCLHVSFNEDDRCIGCGGDKKVVMEWTGWDGEGL